MKRIPLTQGQVALVDDADFARVSALRWHAMRANKTFYAHNAQVGYLHRFLMQPKPGQLVDHRKGNGLDNRRSQLRVCTHAQNLMNRGPQVNNTSGAKGVSWYPRTGKWEAYVKLRGRKHRFGYFKSKAEAIRQRDLGIRRFHGEFAYLNR